MRLDEALSQISDIRRHMARGEVFRGYRSATVAFTGVLGLLVATLQSQLLASPVAHVDRYLTLWLAAAAVGLSVAGAEVWWRARRSGSGLAKEHSLLAAEQFLPSAVVGGLLTLCIWRLAPEAAWMLPGLWALIFSLGIFASYRLLPRQVFWVGSYYVVCGVGCLLWGRGEHELSPWLMGITFGGGQLLGAAILYWTLERDDAASQSE
jgi:hypothetical protein